MIQTNTPTITIKIKQSLLKTNTHFVCFTVNGSEVTAYLGLFIPQFYLRDEFGAFIIK